MDLRQLRCFITVADELHFGRAAQRLDMLPSSLGRQIRLLEEDLGVRLMMRTTRNVVLSEHGALLLEQARSLLADADALSKRIRDKARDRAAVLRIGVIDSAAVGLMPKLLRDFREIAPEVAVHMLEDKTARLLPRLLSGRLDLALIRPSEAPSRRLEILLLLHETVVVAVPESHPLARRSSVTVPELVDQPLIVPERSSRPHSHNVTKRLFGELGLAPRTIQLADEKQTIVNLVAAELGIAIVPRWTSKLAIKGVSYISLDTKGSDALRRLPLAAAWVRDSRDPVRDRLVEMLRLNVAAYSKGS